MYINLSGNCFNNNYFLYIIVYLVNHILKEHFRVLHYTHASNNNNKRLKNYLLYLYYKTHSYHNNKTLIS